MPKTPKSYYARQFGLPEEQIRFFDELTEEQKKQAAQVFGLWHAPEYVFAVKRDGDLVWRREKRNPLFE